jgi:O-methyltransferase involved in polyketide biosynthesis
MTQTHKVDFTSVQWGSVEWTNLCTLYLRACESHSPEPILADHAAAEAVDRIDYDFKRLRRAVQPWSNQFLVALRAEQLDHWTVDVLRNHPDALVLHLGCGLDTRALRVNPPATVQWFDVDKPGVIELRRKLYEERDGYRMVGSSVTDAGWLDQIPTDRPALIVAEGLLMYLGEGEVRELLRRVTDRFANGALLFDTLSPMGPRFSRLFQGGIVKWGTRDVRELERWNPRLHFVEQTSALDGYEAIPYAPQRLLYRLCHATPVRNYDVLNRFEF